MGKLSGCVLILAGLAVGAYGLYEPPPPGGPVLAAESAPVAGGYGTAPANKATDRPNAPAAPQAQPSSSAASEPSKSDKSEKVGPPDSGVEPPTHLVPPVPVPARRPRAAVAAVEVDAVPPRVPVGGLMDDLAFADAAELTSEIQRHLKRIGCYGGDVTGEWSPTVQRAMRTLTERTNATLPVEGPDPVLLAMVQGQAPGACGAACPRGQERIADNRCVPSVLAEAMATKAGVKAANATSNASRKRPARGTVVGSVPPDGAAAGAVRGPGDGRMSLAGPTKAGAPQSETWRRKARPSRSATVAGWSRSRQGRPRVRRAQRPPYSGYSSLPGWAFKFLMP